MLPSESFFQKLQPAFIDVQGVIGFKFQLKDKNEQIWKDQEFQGRLSQLMENFQSLSHELYTRFPFHQNILKVARLKKYQGQFQQNQKPDEPLYVFEIEQPDGYYATISNIQKVQATVKSLEELPDGFYHIPEKQGFQPIYAYLREKESLQKNFIVQQLAWVYHHFADYGLFPDSLTNLSNLIFHWETKSNILTFILIPTFNIQVYLLIQNKITRFKQYHKVFEQYRRVEYGMIFSWFLATITLKFYDQNLEQVQNSALSSNRPLQKYFTDQSQYTKYETSRIILSNLSITTKKQLYSVEELFDLASRKYDQEKSRIKLGFPDELVSLEVYNHVKNQIQPALLLSKILGNNELLLGLLNELQNEDQFFDKHLAAFILKDRDEQKARQKLDNVDYMQDQYPILEQQKLKSTRISSTNELFLNVLKMLDQKFSAVNLSDDETTGWENVKTMMTGYQTLCLDEGDIYSVKESSFPIESKQLCPKLKSTIQMKSFTFKKLEIENKVNSIDVLLTIIYSVGPKCNQFQPTSGTNQGLSESEKKSVDLKREITIEYLESKFCMVVKCPIPELIMSVDTADDISYLCQSLLFAEDQLNFYFNDKRMLTIQHTLCLGYSMKIIEAMIKMIDYCLICNFCILDLYYQKILISRTTKDLKYKFTVSEIKQYLRAYDYDMKKFITWSMEARNSPTMIRHFY